MRQRLGIGTALLGDPAVLVLDEPANGMDPEGIRWMRLLLHDFAGRGGTVLLSSHLLAEVQATVDRLVVIGGGRIVADDSLDVLLAGQGTTVRGLDPTALDAALRARRLRHAAPRRRLAARPTPPPSRSGGSPPPPALVVARAPRDGAGLEDLFFRLTAGDRGDHHPRQDEPP